MPVTTTIDSVIPTQDGPTGHACYDAVVTAADINTLYQTGFLNVDYDRQRGRDTVTGKPLTDLEKVERWAEQLVQGKAYFGQLTWNFRPEECAVEYDEATRTLTIKSGKGTIPDSRHRHLAILKAVESRERGSGFDLQRKFSVKIYTVPASEENRLFFAMNQEGQKADATRSKWLHREGAIRLAAKLVEKSPHLRDNVDVVRDRLSRRNPRLCAFNTLGRAFDEYWGDKEWDEGEATFQKAVDFLMEFWDGLVKVRPELGRLKLEERQKVRDSSLSESAIALTAYVGIARKLMDDKLGLASLKKLGEKDHIKGKQVDYFSRENPIWETIGVLVPVTRRDGTRHFHIRNAKEPRKIAFEKIADRLGLTVKAAPREVAMAEDAT
jgi:hypothetical protein